MFYFKISIISLFLFFSCKSSKSSTNVLNNGNPNSSVSVAEESADSKHLSYFVNTRGDTIKKIVLTDAEWKQKLTESEHNVLRLKGTERPFTGDLLANKEEGIYTCRGCGAPLFASKHKFDSGTGWPSFFDVIDKTCITKDTDYDLGYARTELTCTKCGGHQGHVFSDGPKPTGLRYCINAVSLDFIKTQH